MTDIIIYPQLFASHKLDKDRSIEQSLSKLFIFYDQIYNLIKVYKTFTKKDLEFDVKILSTKINQKD